MARETFNVALVAQAGRLTYEAVLFAASLRHSDPDFAGRLIVLEPQPGPCWNGDPRIADPEARKLLTDEFGAEIIPFESRAFGSSYPNGNKIEGLLALPEDEPFIFFDSDTLITGKLSDIPFDFTRPSASMRREGTWPQIELYGPGYHETWKALYDRFGLDIAPTIDTDQPEEYWARFMYFNAGWFFHEDPKAFGERFLHYAKTIRDDPPDEIICQEIYPWLDQIALPLVIHSFGGGRNTVPEGLLDGDVSCHYRMFPLLFAREADHVIDTVQAIAQPNKVKKVVKQHEAIKRFVYQNKGERVRALFDRDNLPTREQVIRNRIKKENLWMR